MPQPFQENTTFRACAYPKPWRVIAAIPYAVSRATLVALIVLMLLGIVFSPPLLVRLVFFFALLPGLAAWFIRVMFTVDVEIGNGKLILCRRGIYRRGLRIEEDQDKIDRITPWRVPIPGPGVTVRPANSKRQRYDLQTDSPTHLTGVTTGTAITYAQARLAAGIVRWYNILGKYGIFPLLPTIILFRLHQYIMYGGTFGQYYLYGLQPYLSTFAYYWITTLIHMVLYASLLRALAESGSLFAARFAPARAFAVRRWAERTIMILYYGGIPALLALRLL